MSTSAIFGANASSVDGRARTACISPSRRPMAAATASHSLNRSVLGLHRHRRRSRDCQARASNGRASTTRRRPDCERSRERWPRCGACRRHHHARRRRAAVACWRKSLFGQVAAHFRFGMNAGGDAAKNFNISASLIISELFDCSAVSQLTSASSPGIDSCPATVD